MHCASELTAAEIADLIVFSILSVSLIIFCALLLFSLVGVYDILLNKNINCTKHFNDSKSLIN